MARFNEDGNLLGRIGALATLAAVGVLLTRIVCGPGGFCPLPKVGSCCPSSSDKAATK